MRYLSLKMFYHHERVQKAMGVWMYFRFDLFCLILRAFFGYYFGNMTCLLYFLSIFFWFLERYLSIKYVVLQRKCPKSSHILNIVLFWSDLLNSEACLAIFWKLNMFNDTFWVFLGWYMNFCKYIYLKHVILIRNYQKLPIFSPQSGSYAK